MGHILLLGTRDGPNPASKCTARNCRWKRRGANPGLGFFSKDLRRVVTAEDWLLSCYVSKRGFPSPISPPSVLFPKLQPGRSSKKAKKHP